MALTFGRTLPVLRIFDVAKAREFYVEYLGFDVDFEHRFHDNAPLYMQISRANLVLRVSEHYGDGSPGVQFMIETTGVDELHAELGAKKYRYLNPDITDTEWGTRELHIIDPFGNRLTFTERLSEDAVPTTG